MSIQSELMDRLSMISDPRIERSKQYPLNEILFLTVNAMLSGYFDWDEIVDFGREKLSWLRQYSPYTNGIPSHDTVNRVMGLINTKEFESFFGDWMGDLVPKLKDKVLNIDGKSLRGSVDNHLKNMKRSAGGKHSVHLVEAWCSELSMCLGQVKTEEKSNEITAIPELLSMLELEGCMVTIDAMGCQTAIAGQIVQSEGNYLLGLKNNQESLYEAVKALFHTSGGVNTIEQHETMNEGHGRVELRQCRVIDAVLLKEDVRKHWPGLTSLVEVQAHRAEKLKQDDLAFETRYYISSRQGDAAFFGQLVRGHWRIENELHWRLDVIFGEDASRKQKGNAPQNIGIIRRLVLNMLKNNGEPDKVSVNRRMNKCALNDEYRIKTLLF